MEFVQVLPSLAHLSIPRQSNNYRAKLLHFSGTTTLLLLVIVFQGILNFSSATGMGVLGYAAQIPPGEVIKLTNEQRRKEGLAELSENPLLSKAALAKGTDMLNKDYWAHVSPDGVEPWVFITKSGYSYRFAGENLARDFSNARAAIEAWMASPSHRENLMSPKYEEIGIAVVEGDLNGVDTTLIVQMFGTRAGSAAGGVSEVSADTGGSDEPAVAVEEEPVITEKQELVFAEGAAGVSGKKAVASPFDVSKAVSLGISGLFLAVLIIDGVVVSRKNITRAAGRAFAHISFIGMVIAIILIAKEGRIF